MRVLVVAAYRTVDPAPHSSLTEVLAELAREPVTHRVPLVGLTASEVAEYVSLTAAEITSRELVAALHEQTEGNPLFVGETVRLLALEGVRGGSADTELAIPQSVRDVIARRFTHLSEECNSALRLASVLGREFDLTMLARVAGLSEDALFTPLDEAMTARVVSDTSGPHSRFRFAHVLIRDTLYERIGTTSRIQVHRLVVEALEGTLRPARSQDLT